MRYGLLTLLLLWSLIAAPVGAQPLSLTAAYESALQRNFELQSQQYSYRAKKAGVREAWGGVLPQVDATASYGTSEYTRDFDLQRSVTGRDEHTRYDVSLNQVIYSERAFEAISRAKASKQLAEEQLDTLSIKIGYTAIEAFLRARSIGAEKRIVENEQSSHEQRLEQIEQMRQRGFASKADYLDARARLDETRAELAGLKHDYQAALKKLEAVIGISLQGRELKPLGLDLWKRTPSLLKTEWKTVAAENAGAIRRARKELELARATREKESGAHWPELYLSASYSNNDTFATSLREEARVELQLRVPLYKGGSTSARVRRAKQEQYAAKYMLRDAENQVGVEVSRITEELQGSYSRIKSLETAEQSAEAALKAAEEGFRGGVRSLNDVLDSRTRLSDIRRNLVTEVYTNHILQFELYYVSGTLSEQEVRSVASVE